MTLDPTKRINYRISVTHYLAGPFASHVQRPRISKHGHNFFKKWAHLPCDYVIVATTKQRVIGFFRFNVFEYPTKDNHPVPELHAAGTWVEAAYRRRGVAFKMWERAFDFTRPKFINVSTASKHGRKFVRTLRRRWSERQLEWYVEDLKD
jgi:GNAT superfamily N-acetyltransferase